MSISIFLISTPLHAFQAFLYQGSNSLFIIDKKLKGKYDFKSFLRGKFLYLDFNISFPQLLIKTIFISKRKQRGEKYNLYIGNRNNNLSSLIINKYGIRKFIMLDDGLVNYGLQAEKPNIHIYEFKKKLFRFLSSLGLNFICYGYSDEIYFDKVFTVKFLSFVGEFKKKSDNVLVEKIITFDEVKKKYDIEKTPFDVSKGEKIFLSYSQSLEMKNLSNNSNVYFHPRVLPSYNTLPIEFELSNKTVKSGLSSLLLVKFYFYEQIDIFLISDKLGNKENLFCNLIQHSIKNIDTKQAIYKTVP